MYICPRAGALHTLERMTAQVANTSAARPTVCSDACKSLRVACLRGGPLVFSRVASQTPNGAAGLR